MECSYMWSADERYKIKRCHSRTKLQHMQFRCNALSISAIKPTAALLSSNQFFCRLMNLLPFFRLVSSKSGQIKWKDCIPRYNGRMGYLWTLREGKGQLRLILFCTIKELIQSNLSFSASTYITDSSLARQILPLSEVFCIFGGIQNFPYRVFFFSLRFSGP